MDKINDIRDIMKVSSLQNELELQQALEFDKKLRLLLKQDKSLKQVANHLFDLIEDYEQRNWSDSQKIDDAQVEEAEKAEMYVSTERNFIQSRKELIRKKLKEFNMTQQDLGVLLGHGKTYMSELINGVSQFTIKDLVIIHKMLEIKLDKLIPTYLQEETTKKVSESIDKLDNPKLHERKLKLTLG